MQVFRKKLKPWFKQFKKNAAEVTKHQNLKLYGMSHNRLSSYAEKIGVVVCLQPNSYATELAMHMMDVLQIFNETHSSWLIATKTERGFALHNNLMETRRELCEWLNRIARHYMQTEKDYIKAMSEAGFEFKSGNEPAKGILPKLKERAKQG